MLVTPLGIIKVPVRPVQLQNALSPMVFILLGNVRILNPLHPSNAPNPILVTPAGIVKVPVKPEQP